MGSKSEIEWTDATWTPVRARVKDDAQEIAQAKGYSDLLPIIQPGRVGPHCEKVSEACRNCYSETNNGRCLPHNGTGLPFTRRSRDLVDIFLDENILAQPLHWKRPRKIFVCSQTDLFGDFVSDEQIDRVIGTIYNAPWHTYQVLTKRPERMAAYLDSIDRLPLIAAGLHAHLSGVVAEVITPHDIVVDLADNWPLPQLWLGTSIEDQQAADERIPHLMHTPAAVRFLSAEPLLGPIHLRGFGCEVNPVTGQMFPASTFLPWVIVGGESGAGARPMHPTWVRSLRDQCQAIGVPFFFKQWGEWAPSDADWITFELLSKEWLPWVDAGNMQGMCRVGKHAAGAMLDGREWREFPRSILAKTSGAKT